MKKKDDESEVLLKESEKNLEEIESNIKIPSNNHSSGMEILGGSRHDMNSQNESEIHHNVMIHTNKEGYNFSYSNRLKDNENSKSTEEFSSSMVIDEETSTFDLYKGLFFMFISCICKSIFSVLCKFLMTYNQEIHSFQLLVMKSYLILVVSSLLIILFYLIEAKKFLVTETKTLLKLVLRSLFTIASLGLLIYSLKLISISDVFTVYYTYPAIVLVLSVLVLREKAGKLDLVCLVACLVGVLLIIRPDFIKRGLYLAFNSTFEEKNETQADYHKTFILVLVLLSATFKACEDLVIRDIGGAVEPIIFPMVYSFIGFLIFPVPFYLMNYDMNIFIQMDYICWILTFSIALTHFSMQFFMAKALQNEAACRVSMVNYLQLVFMFLTDMFFFNKNFLIFDIVGAILIFSFNFANGLYKFSSRLNKKEKLEQKLESLKKDDGNIY